MPTRFTEVHISSPVPSMCLRAKNSLRTPRWRTPRASAPHKKGQSGSAADWRSPKSGDQEGDGRPSYPKRSERPSEMAADGCVVKVFLVVLLEVTGSGVRERHEDLEETDAVQDFERDAETRQTCRLLTCRCFLPSLADYNSVLRPCGLYRSLRHPDFPVVQCRADAWSVSGGLVLTELYIAYSQGNASSRVFPPCDAGWVSTPLCIRCCVRSHTVDLCTTSGTLPSLVQDSLVGVQFGSAACLLLFTFSHGSFRRQQGQLSVMSDVRNCRVDRSQSDGLPLGCTGHCATLIYWVRSKFHPDSETESCQPAFRSNSVLPVVSLRLQDRCAEHSASVHGALGWNFPYLLREGGLWVTSFLERATSSSSLLSTWKR